MPKDMFLNDTIAEGLDLHENGVDEEEESDEGEELGEEEGYDGEEGYDAEDEDDGDQEEKKLDPENHQHRNNDNHNSGGDNLGQEYNDDAEHHELPRALEQTATPMNEAVEADTLHEGHHSGREQIFPRGASTSFSDTARPSDETEDTVLLSLASESMCDINRPASCSSSWGVSSSAGSEPVESLNSPAPASEDSASVEDILKDIQQLSHPHLGSSLQQSRYPQICSSRRAASQTANPVVGGLRQRMKRMKYKLKNVRRWFRSTGGVFPEK